MVLNCIKRLFRCFFRKNDDDLDEDINKNDNKNFNNVMVNNKSEINEESNNRRKTIRLSITNNSLLITHINKEILSPKPEEKSALLSQNKDIREKIMDKTRRRYSIKN